MIIPNLQFLLGDKWVIVIVSLTLLMNGCTTNTTNIRDEAISEIERIMTEEQIQKSRAAQKATDDELRAHIATNNRISYEISRKILLDSGGSESFAPYGMSIFRTRLYSTDLSNLTLPRTLFGKSEIKSVSFNNTDLSKSALNWNDFIDVNFSNAILSGADLRTSIFDNVDFSNADLANADLRGLDLQNCNLSGAKMAGAKLTKDMKNTLDLTAAQVSEILWFDDNDIGEEPTGG